MQFIRMSCDISDWNYVFQWPSETSDELVVPTKYVDIRVFERDSGDQVGTQILPLKHGTFTFDDALDTITSHIVAVRGVV